MSKIFKITIWCIFFFILLDFGLDCINQRSNIANITGFILIIFNMYIAVRTKCFTQFKNNKDEEND